MSLTPPGRTDLFRRVGEVFGGDQHVQVCVGQQLAGALDVGAFQADHDRDLEADLLGGGDQRFGDRVALGDPAEDVHQHALDLVVAEDDAEGLDRALLGDAAAHVEEVRRLAAVQLDDVHRRHRQAGAVDQAADIPVERDVGLRSCSLARSSIGFSSWGRTSPDVADGGTWRCRRSSSWRRSPGSRPSLVRTSGLISARLPSFVEEDPHEPCITFAASWPAACRQAQRRDQLGHLEILQAEVRVQPLLDDGFGIAGGDLFDLDAALARDHHHRGAPGAVEHHCDVVFGVDVHGFGDEQSS
jgi:hypothetical protein